jgi:hypothetical protein
MKKFTCFVLLLAIFWVPKQVRAAETICIAGNVNEFKSCLNKLSNNQTHVIEITNRIICDRTTNCQFTISNIDRVDIYGTPGSNAGFLRKEKFTNPILEIVASSNVTLSNLTFDDDLASTGCVWTSWTEPTNCKAQIRVNTSENIQLKQLKLTNSKSQAVEVFGKSKNISFKNSFVANTYEQGFIVRPFDVDTVVIEGNTFEKTGGSATPTSGKNITIKNNSFSYSQWKTPWKVGGGQIHISGADGVNIIGNNIFDGVALNNVLMESISGIEFGRDSSNIIVSENNITNNTAAGINNDKDVTLNNVVIKNNNFSTNGANWLINKSWDVPSNWNGAWWDISKGLAHWKFVNNCTKGVCSPLPAQGSLSVSPCYIKTGQTTCSAFLSWMSNFSQDVKVKRGNNELATTKKGNRILSNISTSPETITLFNGNKVLESLQISGIPLGNSGTVLLGDLTNDNKVDIDDYNIFRSEFGRTGQNIISDINKDNKVNIFDLNLLLTNFKN